MGFGLAGADARAGDGAGSFEEEGRNRGGEWSLAWSVVSLCFGFGFGVALLWLSRLGVEERGSRVARRWNPVLFFLGLVLVRCGGAGVEWGRAHDDCERRRHRRPPSCLVNPPSPVLYYTTTQSCGHHR